MESTKQTLGGKARFPVIHAIPRVSVKDMIIMSRRVHAVALEHLKEALAARARGNESRGPKNGPRRIPVFNVYPRNGVARKIPSQSPN